MEELIDTLHLIHGWEYVKTNPEGIYFAPRPKERVPAVRGIRPIRLQPIFMGPVVHFSMPLGELIEVRRKRILAKLNTLLRRGRTSRTVDQLSNAVQFHSKKSLVQQIQKNPAVLRRFRSGVIGDIRANALDLYDQRLNPEMTPTKTPPVSMGVFASDLKTGCRWRTSASGFPKRSVKRCLGPNRTGEFTDSATKPKDSGSPRRRSKEGKAPKARTRSDRPFRRI